MTTLEKIRAEIARKFFEHGFGNTKVCYEVLQILDKYAEQEPTEPLYRLITDRDNLMLLEDYKTGVRTVIEKRIVPCDDAISRQYLIDMATKDGAYDYVSAQEIANAPSVRPQEPKWIPVSERLPKKDREHNTFLVTDSNGSLSISKFYLPLSNSDIDKPYWSGMIDVIAWMPLPKPYEPQESEDKE